MVEDVPCGAVLVIAPSIGAGAVAPGEAMAMCQVISDGNKHAQFLHTEFVMTGILRQEVDISTHVLAVTKSAAAKREAAISIPVDLKIGKRAMEAKRPGATAASFSPRPSRK